MLSVDVQNDICHERGAFSGVIAAQFSAHPVLPRIADCLAAARAAGATVAHVPHVPHMGDTPTSSRNS